MTLVAAYEPIRVEGLSDRENDLANSLLNKLQDKYRRNLLRKVIYDGKRQAEKVSKILPPNYKSMGLVLGWCAKAVDLLALRTKLEGFTWAKGDLDSLGFSKVWDGNMLDSEARQAAESSLTYSTSFITTTAGDASAGEPEVVWQFHDATKATGDWNARSRRLESLIVLTDWDAENRLSGFVLYDMDVTITVARGVRGWEVVNRDEHYWGIPADPLPYKPQLDRPFGRSRISRPMIGIQAAAVRSLLRLEGHMDIYSYPEFWMLGADPSIFTDADGLVQNSWETMMGRIKGIPDDPSAPDPQTARADVKQFSAASPEPHLAALNAYAKLFAREGDLPDSSMAITDVANPTSAEAYDASQYGLIAQAEGAADGWSPYFRRAMIRSLGMLNGRRGWADVPAEMLAIKAKWRDPRFTSRAADADAGAKQLSAVPWLAETEVGLELLGLSEELKERAVGERTRSEARLMVSQLAGLSGTSSLNDDSEVESDSSDSSTDEEIKRATLLKIQMDAFGVARRAGVDPDEAAKLVGHPGMKIAPGSPITLREKE